MQEAKKVLEVQNLFCHVKTGKKCSTLVRDTTFSLYEQKTLALVGESGSGKTTTALSMTRLLAPQSAFLLEGRVLFEGKNLLTMKESELRAIRGSAISMIFQDPAQSLNPVFSVGAQVAEMWQAHLGLSFEESTVHAVKALERVGLRKGDFFEIYPHELSGGMKQRVMIAMALALGPKVLIADEPTTALDVTVQKEICDLLKELQDETGMALLFISHDLRVVEKIADCVAVMRAQEIVEYGPKERIFSNPLHPYTKALFAARPTRDSRKKMLQTVEGKVWDGVGRVYDQEDSEHWAKNWR